MHDLESEKVVMDFVAACAEGDEHKIENTLAPDVINYVTNAKGDVDKLEGSAAYLERIRAMNIPAVKPQIDITQILTIKPKQIMVMVEVKAQIGRRTLHNHAAFLIYLKQGKISEMWMVEALPAYSDEFWKEEKHDF